eukprot:jgi/Mesvir1/3312/Mv25466-RA.1
MSLHCGFVVYSFSDYLRNPMVQTLCCLRAGKYPGQRGTSKTLRAAEWPEGRRHGIKPSPASFGIAVSFHDQGAQDSIFLHYKAIFLSRVRA